MLIDTRKKQPENQKGFNPEVQNEIIETTAGVWSKTSFIILTILTLGLLLIFYVGKKNWFNQTQMKINEASSNLEVQLAQRKDTLVKLVDATKSSMKFEKELLTDVTSLRSSKVNTSNLNEVNKKVESGFSKLLATFEQYPQIKTTDTIAKLMQSAEYLEREIAASRRLYNSIVNQFNNQMVSWPANIPASFLKLHTFALFSATAEQKKDVSLSLN